MVKQQFPTNERKRFFNAETAVKVAAQEFADLIRDVEKRLGTIQAQLLYDAILRGFEIRCKNQRKLTTDKHGWTQINTKWFYDFSRPVLLNPCLSVSICG